MKSLAELQAIRDKARGKVTLREGQDDAIRVLVGMATCGIAAGARPVLTTIVDEVAKRGLQNVMVTQTGCIGICQFEPVVEVVEPGKDKITYVKMTPEKAVSGTSSAVYRSTRPPNRSSRARFKAASSDSASPRQKMSRTPASIFAASITVFPRRWSNA